MLVYPFVVWNMYRAKKERIAEEIANSTKQTQKDQEKHKKEFDEIDAGLLLTIPRFFFGLSAQVIVAFSI